MVKITNGSRTIEVTRGVYKEMYAPQGWETVEKEKPERESIETPKREAIEEEVETPLSEMNVSQLKALAEARGVDVSPAKNKQEMREIISKRMGE